MTLEKTEAMDWGRLSLRDKGLWHSIFAPSKRGQSAVYVYEVTETSREDVEQSRRMAQYFAHMSTIFRSALSTSSVLDIMAENASLRMEIEQVRARLDELEKRLPAEKVVVLREISREQAKEEIRRLFSGGRTLYYSDVAEELRLDLELVVDLCRELEAEGEVVLDETAR